MDRSAVALASVLAAAAPGAGAQDQDGAFQPFEYDPSLKLMQVAAESLAQNTQGRYGIMGMDFRRRTNFVYSEGGFFDCGSFQLLPAACSFWLSTGPAGAILEFGPDSLIAEVWSGDSAATEALALGLGRSVLERWLRSGGMLGTTLSDAPSGLPYVTCVWDCMVMLALADSRLEGSSVPRLGSGDFDSLLAEYALPGTTVWGATSITSGSCRAAVAAHLPGGRRIGLVFFADSLESESLAVERLRLLSAVMLTSVLHPPGFDQ